MCCRVHIVAVHVNHSTYITITSVHYTVSPEIYQSTSIFGNMHAAITFVNECRQIACVAEMWLFARAYAIDASYIIYNIHVYCETAK